MLVTLRPSQLKGSVTLPPSKSAGHRAIICAALAGGKSVISPITLSEDMKATLQAVEAMGAVTQLDGDTVMVDGSKMFTQKSAEIECLESGSTLRFLIPVAAAGGVQATFTGKGRLPQRPIGLYSELLPRFGVRCGTAGGLPFTIHGKLRAGQYEVPGNISSQYITGLLLALPLLEEDSLIRLSTPLESKGYVDMTIGIMKEFGVTVRPIPEGYLIRGRQAYQPRRFTVEGDWSQAAFFMSAATLGSELLLVGLKRDSMQGDKEALSLFQRFGMQAEWTERGLFCKGKPLYSLQIDASQIPDLVPALAVTAAFCPGKTVIYGAARLRIKESDRIKSVTSGLRVMGGQVSEHPDGLDVTGSSPLAGGLIQGYNDHRIVMAFSMAALAAPGVTQIDDAQSIAKSYPDFFQEYVRLGGNADVIRMG